MSRSQNARDWTDYVLRAFVRNSCECPQCSRPAFKSEHIMFSEDIVVYKCKTCGYFGSRNGSWIDLEVSKGNKLVVASDGSKNQ